MLTIEPEGGICSRMRVMHSSIALARDIGQPVRLVWIKNRDLGCEIEHLLEVPKEFRTVHTFSKLHKSKLDGHRYKIRRYCRFDYLKTNFKNDQVEEMMRNGFDFSELSRRRRTHIRCWQPFYEADAPIYPFRPAQKLQDRIQSLTSRFRDTIGVHIRRTDHRPAREFSPTSLFKERMNALIAAEPGIRFYLSSDDPRELDAMKTEYGDRIICAPEQDFGRQSTEALQCAVVDLFCLAATRKVLGSFKSTFSDTAARLGNIPFEPVQGESEPVVQW
ncbi:hypothetical protein [Nitratireductor sp. XY-223]|uniref:hypothetical protein n=1 Tax=Nitratireductor sp. XY-223 TaxID=2561926 RepID=UPI0010AB3502|nr:hypothetical protein [Nitratireductor sp. XY-223]